MPNIVPFQFEDSNVRTHTDECGNPWFVAKDVCEILGVQNTSQALDSLDDDEKGISLTYTLGGQQEVSTVSESGLYALILRSRKATTPGTVQHRFRKWVTSEVIPSIRKTGSYSAVPQTLAEALRLAADKAEEAERLTLERDYAIKTKSWISTSREARAMNAASQVAKKVKKLEIELDQSRHYASIKRMESLCPGEHFDWRLLKKVSADLNLPPVDVFDANYGTVKAYHVEAWKRAYGLELIPGGALH